MRNKAGKGASNSKAKVNSKQKEGLIDCALTAFAKKLKKKNATAILHMSIPYVMFGYFGDKMAYAARITEEKESINKLLGSLTNHGVSFQSLMPSFHPRDLFVGVAVGITMRLIVYFKGKNEVGEDGKAVYKDDAFPLTKELRDKISDAAIQSYERGGEEVTLEFDSVQKEQTKTNPEKSGKEGARQGKPSVLKILQEDSKVPGADRPLKITMEKAKKAVGEVC